ncbi:DedA family protein [Gaiella sp.]|uniref:DedA family protein n=1 Tax=Gaiella sp. TaxID=2663207 RepID=UPI003264391B
MLFSILSTLTDAITTAIGNYGLYAVFLLMLIDAVLPAASEVVMVYGGAIASGAIAGTSVNLFGYTFEPGLQAYLAIAIAGTVGYLIGAVFGWEIGRRGGRPYLEKHGRWLHLDHEKLERAEAWFLRWDDWAVFLGRLTPVIRSFVSVPAGMFEAPFKRYTVLTLLGSAIWSFVFAGIGWAAGANWESFHHAFRYADIAVGVIIVGAVAWLGWRFKQKRAAAGAD